MNYKETLEGNITNGLTWQIERQRGSLSLTILGANGEELETIDLTLEDIERLGQLFYEAKGLYSAISPSERKAGK